MPTLSPRAQEIKKQYDALLRLRKAKGEAGTARYKLHELVHGWDKHATLYRPLKRLVQNNEDALLEVILCGDYRDDVNATDRRYSGSVDELAFLGGHGGSVAYDDNVHWHGFMAKLREHYGDLPSSMQISLGWLSEVHGW